MILGELCLLAALATSGYAAFACIVGWQGRHDAIRRSGVWAGAASVLTLSATSLVLLWALLTKDFRFDYVVQYCDNLLPWQYALSAFWVGQAGSLLLWAWFVAVLAAVYRFRPTGDCPDFRGHRAQHGHENGTVPLAANGATKGDSPVFADTKTGTVPSDLRDPAFGLLMAFLCFLVAVMVFAADPMQPSLVAKSGAGLAPSLQHPAMLWHPPIVFLGYAAWAVPCALALAALASPGRQPGDRSEAAPNPRADARGSPSVPATVAWAREARSWALFAWIVLGAGILLGAEWAYQELGWGGYWAWDPVENGSLIPWLTGTALVHCLMTVRYLGILKKSAMFLAVATFALCNFATFLTRSGIFSSLHEFSRSPLAWMFLAATLVPIAAGGGLLFLRRSALRADRPITSLWSREAWTLLSCAAILLLTLATLLGTLAAPLSGLLPGPKIAVGVEFYNNALIPCGLFLLAAIATVPLLRWGQPPTAEQKKTLLAAAGTGAIAVALAFVCGIRHPVALGVAALAAASVAAPVAALVLDARRSSGKPLLRRVLGVLAVHRRQYAGFLIHAGIGCFAIGVTGSLGTQREDFVLRKGESVAWAGYDVRYADLIQRDLPDKVVVETQLEVSRDGGAPFTMLPAQHLHRLQNQWAGKVAIRASWTEDFYVILHGSEGPDGIRLTCVENPAMRWLWLSGWIAAAGALVGLWPTRRAARSVGTAVVLPSRSTVHRGGSATATPTESLRAAS
jgi:cytochrome c-type biogenesis protein CcmF